MSYQGKILTGLLPLVLTACADAQIIEHSEAAHEPSITAPSGVEDVPGQDQPVAIEDKEEPAAEVIPNSTTAAHQLVSLLSGMTTLQGDFQQTQYDLEGELVQESSGLFALARPGKLLWKTIEPFPQELVTNGETLWLYDPDLEQVTIQQVSKQLKQTPAVIISGDLNTIESEYDVSLDQVADSDKVFILSPKVDSETFERLTLVFSADELSAMTLLDGFGQDTHFQLSGQHLNKKLADSLFEFIPPEGTDVLINE